MSADGDGEYWFARLRSIAYWFFVMVLAWAPFPLGSNRPWSAGLLLCLVSIAWLLWLGGTYNRPAAYWRIIGRLGVPIVCLAAVFLWAVFQTVPWAPKEWNHPLWSMAGEALGKNIPAAISINPWRTLFEAQKLAAYFMAGILTVVICQQTSRARQLVRALIAIGAFYGLYTIVLALLGSSQFLLFYGVPSRVSLLSGPFVGHNNLAAFEGLLTIVTLAVLSDRAYDNIAISRGLRVFVWSGLNFITGRGAPLLAALFLSFATVIASASRAGFVSMLAGLVVIAVLYALSARANITRMGALLSVLTLGGLLLLLLGLSGDTLGERLGTLTELGPDEIRRTLWNAGWRMIHDAPYLGLGLGTFQDAYPIYADRVVPYVVDKLHNDYLELVAGIGLPAAGVFLLAYVAAAAVCLRGVFTRRRGTFYPLIGIGALVMMGAHSAIDFSLQIPAIGLYFSVLLGLAMAQSFPTNQRYGSAEERVHTVRHKNGVSDKAFQQSSGVPNSLA